MAVVITGWESPAVLQATLADTLRRYTAQVAAERLTVGRREDGVTVVIGADGFLVAVDIADWVRRRYGREQVAEFVADAVWRAEQAAARRRGELARAVEY